MEGDSVTLHTGLTEIQRDKFSIQWMFGDRLIAEIPKKQKQFNESDGKFSGRLKLDNQTGYLNITNIRTTDSGDYELQISSSNYTINRRINVTVTGSGLSPGAVAGIVVVVVLLVAAAAAAVVIYYCHKICKLGSGGQENGQNHQNQHTDDPANEKTELANRS
ncbi:carcinoembryonic antigen-related cell adhesion molecule 1 [Labeo rohita]|nr:carcinoembryonic antigen-related cell adhesion molecule 1 [Labeo rohita]